MKKGSKRYQNLVARLGELRKNLLSFLPDPPASKLTYSDQELDLTRAYVVLAHAEIESFCEEIASTKANAAQSKYQKSNSVSPCLRRLIAYHIAKKGKCRDNVSNPKTEVVTATLASFTETVKKNHGLKRANLEKLFYPLGAKEVYLDPTWMVQMDAFGSQRGGWAHTSVKTQQPPDPLSELKSVLLLLPGLKKLDEDLAGC